MKRRGGMLVRLSLLSVDSFFEPFSDVCGSETGDLDCGRILSSSLFRGW